MGGRTEQAFLPKGLWEASRICPNLDTPTAFLAILFWGSKERKRKTYLRIMLVCINVLPKWLTLKPAPAGERWRLYSGCRARESKRRCLIIQDEKGKISKWYERDILKQLQSWNGKPAAWFFWRNSFEIFPTGRELAQNRILCWIYLALGFLY